MPNTQSNKALVLEFYQQLDAAQGDDINAVLNQYIATDNYLWRGMHPFYEQHSADDVGAIFWQPFRQAFQPVQRRQDIFMSGANFIDQGESEWVCSMGHLMGLFDQSWLGIPPTGKMTFLRYCEFNRIENGKIAETALFCDIIGVMQQAGLQPLPLQTGAAIITPGPQNHQGLMFEQQDDTETEKTLKLINRMCNELTTSDMHSDQNELAQTWHEDMIWYGPAGIGATYTLGRYEQQHQGPFNAGLKDIRFNGHIARFAEGDFGGWFGWANLTMKTSGGFMGLPATDKDVDMRVVDIYRRDGDKLAENWIFIDILHFLSMQGLNVLERMESIHRV